jgi:hypothetical protein
VTDHEVRGRVLWLAAGVAAIVGGTLLGWDGRLLEAVATPPALVRAALVGVCALVTLRLLGAAVARLEAGRSTPEGSVSGRDLVTLVRGVRLVFLAVAVVAAGAGWLMGHPVPFVVALVIAGVDVLETSFLLLVVAMRPEG